MTAHLIGEITLSISTFLYFIWFLPQILLNFKRKSTQGLSLWMHGLLFIGYTADLLYGFGRHMQWQYRLVTIVGLIFLVIEHGQFLRYGFSTRTQSKTYWALTVLILLMLAYAICNFTVFHHGKTYYDAAGFVSALCWMTYLLPQLIKNFKLKSTQGLSFLFVVLTCALSVLDIASTLLLQWDWPSVMSECVTLIKKSILIFQCYYYRRSVKQSLR